MSRLRAIAAAAGLALLIGAGAGVAEAGIVVELQPAALTVGPGATFDLEVVVAEPGSSFNAFDAIIGHDPAALTLVEMAPLALQEGTLMTTACGSRFHRFRRGAERDTATVVLLCNGVSVGGPGTIYRLRFQASSTPQTTTVQLLPGTRFFDAGIAVAGVTTGDATISILAGVDVPTSADARGGRLTAQPNPFAQSTRLVIDSAADAAQRLDVFDARGQLVRRLTHRRFAAGRNDVAWDGRTDGGESAPAGLYFVRLSGGAAPLVTRLVRTTSR